MKSHRSCRSVARTRPLPVSPGSTAAALVMVCYPQAALAHGESVRGVGGVGVNTIGGEVSEGYSLSLRYDLRSYALFSDAELLRYQQAGENVHQHSREHSAFLGATFGLMPGWDVSALLQANQFDDFSDNGDAYALANRTVSRTDTSRGLGDLLLLGRRQLAHSGGHHLAAVGGLKLPTGNFRQRTNQGDIVGTHNQPGSGSVDFQIGAAYTLEVGGFALSADTLLRVNSQGAGSFRSGNSIQADVSTGYHVLPWLTPSVELNSFFQERDIEQDLVKKNSGVSNLFATGGVRFSFGVHGVLVAGSLPLWQDFPGISNAESFRLSLGYSLSFGDSERDSHRLPSSPPEPPPSPRLPPEPPPPSPEALPPE